MCLVSVVCLHIVLAPHPQHTAETAVLILGPPDQNEVVVGKLLEVMKEHCGYVVIPDSPQHNAHNNAYNVALCLQV